MVSVPVRPGRTTGLNVPLSLDTITVPAAVSRRTRNRSAAAVPVTVASGTTRSSSGSTRSSGEAGALRIGRVTGRTNNRRIQGRVAMVNLVESGRLVGGIMRDNGPGAQTGRRRAGEGVA